MSYTMVPNLPPPIAYLEVCIHAADAGVGPGPWKVTISGNGQPATSESVLAGQCSGDVLLPLGNYTVTESLRKSATVTSIAGAPIQPVSVDLAHGSGVFATVGGTTETATFTDSSSG